MQLEQFLDILACPDCLEPIRRNDEALTCVRCGARFPVRDGRPLIFPASEKPGRLRELLDSEAGRRMQAEYDGAGDTARPGLRGRLRAFLDRLKIPIHQFPHKQIDKMYQCRGEATRILSVGGGPTRNNEKDLNLNVGLFPNVDLVADAHYLPFLSGSVDGVWCNAVLEHVEDAERIAREIERVLRPGGMVFVTHPFIFAYHAYPADFRRATLTGLEQLFAGCEKVQAATCVGPTYALILLGDLYLRTYLPLLLRMKTNLPLRAVFALYTLCFYPFKHLDRLLNPRPESHWQAATLYYLGRKPS